MKITFTKKNAYKNNSYETLEFIEASVKVIIFCMSLKHILFLKLLKAV